MKLKCPECRKTFPWEKDTAFPRFCPLCREDIGTDCDDDMIPMPFIRSSAATARGQSSDAVYRQMEAGSEQRAQMAASQLGVSAADMADLKITNLREAKNPGEVAAIPVQNAVTQVMDKGIGGFQGMNGAEFAKGTNNGLYPRAGMNAVRGVQRLLSK